MKSGTWRLIWERVDHAFSLIREGYEVAATVEAVHTHLVTHYCIWRIAFHRHRQSDLSLSSPRDSPATVIQEIYIASLPDTCIQYSIERLAPTKVPFARRQYNQLSTVSVRSQSVALQEIFSFLFATQIQQDGTRRGYR